MKRASGLLAAVVVVLLAVTCARAEENPIFRTGDTVAVRREGVQLRRGDQSPVPLAIGTKLEVIQVREKWIWSGVTVQSTQYLGWMHEDEVKLVAMAPENVKKVRRPSPQKDPSTEGAWDFVASRRVGNWWLVWRFRSKDEPMPIEGRIDGAPSKRSFAVNDGRCTVLTGEKDQNGDVIREFDVPDGLVRWLGRGKTTGLDLGLRRAYLKEDEDRIVQVLVRYSRGDGGTSELIEGMQESYREQPEWHRLQENSVFRGSTTGKECSALRVTNGRLYVLKHEGTQGVEYRFSTLQQYLKALDGNDWPDLNRTGSILETGALGEGLIYNILTNDASRRVIMEVHSRTRIHPGFTFKPLTLLQGTWLKGSRNIELYDGTGVAFRFVSEAALRAALDAPERNFPGLANLKPLPGAAILTFMHSSMSGGMCPTFVQLPEDIDADALLSSAGRLDVGGQDLAGKIMVPIDGCRLRGDIPIFGLAAGKKFQRYRVEFGRGRRPTSWEVINTSTTPQPSCEVGVAQLQSMTGDVDIRGNLATWNTGLKNWFHLPWHPPEDPTDENGLYSIRLVVEGEDGTVVQDCVTGEVGRAIAQCRAGIAISPDERVVMRFPEQSLTNAFRVYTILPIDEVGVETPATSDDVELLGSAYRVAPAGDKFIKDVTIEFSVAKDVLRERSPERVGVLQLDVRRRGWKWLSTARLEDGPAFVYRASLTELPLSQSAFAVAADVVNQRSVPASEEEPPQPVVPLRAGVLLRDTFEEHVGLWKPRDRYVGASLMRERPADWRDGHVLKVTNEASPGNFAVTVLARPFDVREYPVMSFDYRITPGVKTDFYVRVNGRWYNLGFTGDPMEFRHRDVNISNLGRIPGITANDGWHHASTDLGKLLLRRTRHTRVDEIVMAHWHVGGYMKLEFGPNQPGATYFIDNFQIGSGPASADFDDLVIETFDDASSKNLVGGPRDTFLGPGEVYCRAAIVDDPSANRNPNESIGQSRVLQLSFDSGLQPEGYCGFWTALMGKDLEQYAEVTLRLRAADPLPPIMVGLRYRPGAEASVLLTPYVGSPDERGWRTASVPLSVFGGLPSLSGMEVFFLTFTSRITRSKGDVHIDNIRFRGQPSQDREASSGGQGIFHNFLADGGRTAQAEAACISAGLHEDRSASPVTRAIRISYGGSIGLDYGEGRFSFATWETGLLGFDARKYDQLVLKIRGERGGERPNIYLDDGTTRRCWRAKEFKSLTSAWQEICLPLAAVADHGVDLSHLEALRLAFEWEQMSGTIYLSDIRFERSSVNSSGSR